MLTGFTKDELAKFTDELKEKTHKGVMALYQAAADGGIIYWDDMLSCLQSLANRYEHEYPDYNEDIYNADRSEAHDAIKDITTAKSKADVCGLQEHAKMFIDFYPEAERIMRQWVKDGKFCDEYGRPLSSDLEHRVFEIVKGGKFKKN